MVVLASSFLSSTLSLAHHCSPLEAQIRTLSPSPLAFNNTQEQPRKQTPSHPTPSSNWISSSSAQKSQMKRLDIEEMGASAAGHDPFLSHQNPNLLLNANLDTSNGPEGPTKAYMKKPARGPRRVVFSPQKARELRKKLKGSESFHDFMYHSSIASRLASHDS